MSISKETVLYYYPEQNKEVSQTKAILAVMGIRIKNLAPSQLGQTVGQLAGLSGKMEEKTLKDAGEEPKGTSLPDSVLVFCGFSEKKLDMTLWHLMKAGVSREVYKAMLTETNRSWTFLELYEELKRERKAIEEQKNKKKADPN